MTIAQMRLFLREGERIRRQERAAFLGDVYAAAGAVMSEEAGKALQERIDGLLRDD